MSIDALKSKLRELEEARRNLAGSKTILADRKLQFDRQNRELNAQLSRETDAVAAAELMVRTLAIEIFKTTADKKPTAGVEVKITKEYDIDEKAAFAWAVDKGMCLIPATLNVEAIKKLATVEPLPFVTIRDEPKPAIAKDLDKVLVEEPLPVAAAAAPVTVVDDEDPF